jgi:hypothetical protein
VAQWWAGGGGTDAAPGTVQRIEGKTRKTWKFADFSKDRVSVELGSNGRPVDADIELWVGPDWTPFKVRTYSEDGALRPIRTLVGTRNKAVNIEVRNIGQFEHPISAVATYAEGALAEVPQMIPATTEGTRCDGSAIRSYTIDPSAKHVDVVLQTDGKQLNARMELLSGPNTPKQTYEVFTNNGLLNSLVVRFSTPDVVTTLRVNNLAPLEFPFDIFVKEEGGGVQEVAGQLQSR